jgi:hypothetical protein
LPSLDLLEAIDGIETEDAEGDGPVAPL